MTVTIKDGFASLAISLGVLIVLTGCSSQKTATATQDQSSLPRQEQRTSSESIGKASPKPTEEVRVTEAGVPPEPAQKSSPVASEQQEVSPTLTSPAPQTGSVRDVFFDFDSFALKGDARTTLETNTRLFKSEKSIKILIEGHCDERGTAAYNLLLGEKRAQATKRYLEDLGVPSSDIQVISYGKERPSCVEHRESCWQQNRRAHFVVR
jgi:peptidoglycan-associated lipoprotein